MRMYHACNAAQAEALTPRRIKTAYPCSKTSKHDVRAFVQEKYSTPIFFFFFFNSSIATPALHWSVVFVCLLLFFQKFITLAFAHDLIPEKTHVYLVSYTEKFNDVLINGKI